MGPCQSKKKQYKVQKVNFSIKDNKRINHHDENPYNSQNFEGILKNKSRNPSDHPLIEEQIMLQDIQKEVSQVQIDEPVNYNIPQNLLRQSTILDALVEGNEDDYYGPDEIQYSKSRGLSSIIIRNEPQIKWTPGEKIGQGSYGVVLMGLNKQSGKVMAVKQVELTQNNQKNDREKIESFKIEIQFLSRLVNKNIVSYYGTERTEKSMNIFLEYIAGGSLQSILSKFGKFKESLVKVYTKQILEGLIYLHDHGVVHRDIKSGNILLDSNGQCKLADFGNSKKLSEISRSDMDRSIQGTPNYMAPEVVLQKKSGRKSDIWSLGCTIIEFITGKPPWNEIHNAITIMIKIARSEEPPKLPDNLSEEAQDFLSNCLQIDPKKRWTARQLSNHGFLVNNNLKPLKSNPKKQINLNGNPMKSPQQKSSRANSSDRQLYVSPRPHDQIELGVTPASTKEERKPIFNFILFQDPTLQNDQEKSTSKIMKVIVRNDNLNLQQHLKDTYNIQPIESGNLQLNSEDIQARLNNDLRKLNSDTYEAQQDHSRDNNLTSEIFNTPFFNLQTLEQFKNSKELTET